MSKKVYEVELPVLCKVYVTVTASNKDEAYNKAVEKLLVSVKEDEDENGNDAEVTYYEWEAYKRLLSGNCFHGLISQASVEEE